MVGGKGLGVVRGEVDEMEHARVVAVGAPELGFAAEDIGLESEAVVRGGAAVAEQAGIEILGDAPWASRRD